YFEPNRRLRGWLHSEDFFQGRPTSYWSKVLRQGFVEGESRVEGLRELSSESEAIPVLIGCARNPDVRARLGALSLLTRSKPGQIGRLWRDRAFPVCLDALHDQDRRIGRFALASLPSAKEKAPSAVPAIAALLDDPDEQTASQADALLWSIDPDARAKQLGWR